MKDGNLNCHQILYFHASRVVWLGRPVSWASVSWGREGVAYRQSVAESGASDPWACVADSPPPLEALERICF